VESLQNLTTTTQVEIHITAAEDYAFGMNDTVRVRMATEDCCPAHLQTL
jgi:hypothetical protein